MDENTTDSVYRPAGWSDVADLFAELDFGAGFPVIRWLTERASLLLAGWRDRHPAVAPIVSNWHPELVGRSDQVLARRPTEDDARVTVARELGFNSWTAVETGGGEVMDPEFESTVDAILAGDDERLVLALTRNPALVTRRSAFGHRATLLHYLGSNGVETERQVVPRNGAALIATLLEAGADAEATMQVYGGSFTTLELLETSAHPWQAGVGESMVVALGSSP
ncbi:MAG: hypothetical protein ACR2QK_21410 [Acidimicrobiales bacterium]